MICSNKINPDRFKICRGYLCLLQSNYAFLDRRGRRSLQGEIKLPYENHAFAQSFLYLHIVYGVDLLKLVEGVDFDDVREGAGAHSNFIVIDTMVECDLIPIKLFAAGHIVDLFNVLFKTGAVLVVPIGDSEHVVAVRATERKVFDVSRTVDVEAPVLCEIGGNSEVIRGVLIFRDQLGIIEQKVGFKNVAVFKQVACAIRGGDVVRFVEDLIFDEFDGRVFK